MCVSACTRKVVLYAHTKIPNGVLLESFCCHASLILPRTHGSLVYSAFAFLPLNISSSNRELILLPSKCSKCVCDVGGVSLGIER